MGKRDGPNADPCVLNGAEMGFVEPHLSQRMPEVSF